MKTCRGRPRLERRHKSYEATKPWPAKGMSRSTWYRRRAERKRRTNKLGSLSNSELERQIP